MTNIYTTYNIGTQETGQRQNKQKAKKMGNTDPTKNQGRIHVLAKKNIEYF
jgi:hypothetical protein